MTITRFAAAALLLPALIACESVDSGDVLTDGMYADLTAETLGEGNGTRATAILRVGGATSNTFVRLTGDDLLTVSVDGGDPVELSEQNIGDIYSYTADLDADVAGTQFDFAFTRAVDDGAPSSVAELPDPFELSAPVEDEIFSRQDSITVTWDPSGSNGTMIVRASGDCFLDGRWDVQGDPGSFVIEAGEIEAHEGQEDSACDATLTVQRRKGGTLDAGFGEGGLVYGQQERSLSFRSDP